MLSYAITDSSNFSFSTISQDLDRISKIADFILYRDKNSPDYSTNAKIFTQEAKKRSFKKIFIQNDIDLAISLGCDIHFSSPNIPKISEAKSKNLFTIASTHNKDEIELASKLGVNMITLSPLFATPNKGEPLGEKRFQELVKMAKVPVIALGGIIKKEQIDMALSLGAVGFASIRYFGR